jgi:hypothetical protein
MALTPVEIQQKYASIFANNTTGDISEADLRDFVKDLTDYLGAAEISDVIPAWAAGLTFQTDATDDGEFCTYTDSGNNIRLWQTKTNDNIGNPPPNTPGVTSNTHWQEVSASSGSAFVEWSPGIYGSGLIIVFYNNAFYKLEAATRPFTSANIVTETANGDWVIVGGAGGGTGGGGVGDAYATIALMLADQANQDAKMIYPVTNATGDPSVTSGYAYYEYLGVANGVIGDYRKLSEQEAMQFADDSIWEHIFFASLSPDFGVITRPWNFKATSKTDTGGTATITTSADAPYTLGTTVTAGGYLKVTGGTLNMRSSIKVERA